MNPSVARNTPRSSTRQQAQFFSGRRGPGFSPPAIVPNVTRRVSRSLCVRCTTPAKRRRRLRVIVSTLSPCLLKGPGIRPKVVCALSATEANDP